MRVVAQAVHAATTWLQRARYTLKSSPAVDAATAAATPHPVEDAHNSYGGVSAAAFNSSQLSTSHLGSCRQISCAAGATEATSAPESVAIAAGGVGQESAMGAVGSASTVGAAGATSATGGAGQASTAGVAGAVDMRDAPDEPNPVEAAMVWKSTSSLGSAWELQHGHGATIGFRMTFPLSASGGSTCDAESYRSTQKPNDRRQYEQIPAGVEKGVHRSRGSSAGGGPKSPALVSKMRIVHADQQIATGTRDHFRRSPSAEGGRRSPGASRKAVQTEVGLVAITSFPKELLTSTKPSCEKLQNRDVLQPSSSMPSLAWAPRHPAAPQNLFCLGLEEGAAPPRYGGYSAGGRPGSSAKHPQRGGLKGARRVLASREERFELPDAKIHRMGFVAVSSAQLDSAKAFYERLNGGSGGGLLRQVGAGSARSLPRRQITCSSRQSTGKMRERSVPACVQRPSSSYSQSPETWLRASKARQVPACVGPAAAFPAAAAVPAAAADGVPSEAGVLPLPLQLLSPRSGTQRASTGDCAKDRDVLMRLRIAAPTDAAAVPTAVATAAATVAATAAVAAARDEVAAARDEVVATAALAAKRATEAEAVRQRRRAAEYQRRWRQQAQREAEMRAGEVADWHPSFLFTLAAARRRPRRALS